MVERDRARGTLLGLACGDALGRPVEGWSAERIDREYGTLRKFVGGGVHDRPPGTVTDDTQLATLLARSLVDRGRFDRDDFVDRLVEWYRSQPFGIGGTTTEALSRIDAGMTPEEAAERARNAKPPGEKATNGSVMRCGPLAIAYADDRAELRAVSRASSRVTHIDPRCLHACAALNQTIAAALSGDEAPLRTALDELQDAPASVVDRLESIPHEVDPDTLVASNDAIETVRTASYHALSATDLEPAIVSAVNEGGDTDTVGAVAGAIAGARFGASDLPDRWLTSVEGRSELAALADRLAALDPA